MSLRANLFDHNGAEIYLVDYSNIKSADEFLAIINETGKFREGLVNIGKMKLPILVDFTNGFFNPLY